MTLTLLCAGALHSPSAPGIAPTDRSPEPTPRGRFARLLRGARLTDIEPQSIAPSDSEPALLAPDEAWLHRRFALPPGHGPAAYEAVGEPSLTGSTETAGFIVRPVSLHVGLDHLVLQAPQLLELTDTESRALFDDAVAWLAPEPVRLSWISAQCWQLAELEPDKTQFSTLRGASSHRACGRNIDAWLPRGAGARGWRRLVNEVQMRWHTHPVNASRLARGAPVINGLWLEGPAPVPLATAFQVVASRNPVLIGLANASGAHLVDPTDAHALTGPLRAAIQAKHRALVDADFWRPALTDDSLESRTEAWRGFDDWFDSLGHALRIGASPPIEVVLTGNHSRKSFRPSPWAPLAFWRRVPVRSLLADSP